MMKISKSTMDVLKNFSEINQSIVIKEGNQVRTISALKNILAKASVGENFPKDFAIYDLPTFIGFHSTMNDPDFDFGDECMTLSDDKGRGKYFYAEESVVVTPPDKEIEMPETDINFELKTDYSINQKSHASILYSSEKSNYLLNISNNDLASYSNYFIGVGYELKKSSTSNLYKYKNGSNLNLDLTTDTLTGIVETK